MPKSEPKSRALKLTVPEPLAQEIRRLADLSRRSAQEVADTVFGEVFSGYTPATVGTAWMEQLQAEILLPPPSGPARGASSEATTAEEEGR
jgi:hypothetical protein